MTKQVLTALARAAHALLSHWPAVLVLATLYAALVAACFLFVTTREATAWQLLLTLLTALAAPVLFFALQAGGTSYAVGETSPGELLRRAARTFWKLLVVSLPVVLVGVLGFYLLNKVERRMSKARADAGQAAAIEVNGDASAADEGTLGEVGVETTVRDGTRKLPPVRWGYVALVTVRLLLFGVFLPLILIQLWLAAARDGLLHALAKSWRYAGRAFTPRVLLTYAVGMILFGLLPYCLLFTRTPAHGAGLEISLFTLRLLLAFALTLGGWLVTLRALNETEAAPV